MDTDWCPEEVLQYALALFEEHELHCTVFATGLYTALKDGKAPLLEIGVHPNFNDTASVQHEAKLQELLNLYPHAQGVSSHAMMSSTPLLHLFKQAGLKYDRNLLRYKETEATPFYYYNGLLRVPIFWEDDIWFADKQREPFAANAFERSDLPLVFNFHPIHLYLNTYSPEHYAAFKPYYHEARKLLAYRHEGYGVFSYFRDLIAHLRANQIATGLLSELLAT